MEDENNASTRPSDERGRIGRWMVFASWILMLALLTLLFSRWLNHQENPNHRLMTVVNSAGESELLLQRNRAGHYVSPGELNGVAVTFLLDTGATYVAVPLAVAEEAGLARGVEAESVTASGIASSWVTEIGEVKLGPIVMQDVRASIIPSMPGDEVLLGMSFLKHLRLEQQGDVLRVTVP
jgi:aspartyl protease family protein